MGIGVKTEQEVNAPLIMLSISVDDSLPTELEIVMLALRPEVFSVATIFNMPLMAELA